MPASGQTITSQSIVKACSDAWDEEFLKGVKNSDNCSGFVKGVALKLGIVLPAGAQADALIADTFSKTPWTVISGSATQAAGVVAKTKAVNGGFVIAGLQSSEQKKLPTQGHVAIVVDGALYHGLYPKCWGGSTGSAQSQGTKSTGEIFATADRDKVHYWYWAGAGIKP